MAGYLSVAGHVGRVSSLSASLLSPVSGDYYSHLLGGATVPNLRIQHTARAELTRLKVSLSKFTHPVSRRPGARTCCNGFSS